MTKTLKNVVSQQAAFVDGETMCLSMMFLKQNKKPIFIVQSFFILFFIIFQIQFIEKYHLIFNHLFYFLKSYRSAICKDSPLSEWERLPIYSEYPPYWPSAYRYGLHKPWRILWWTLRNAGSLKMLFFTVATNTLL